MKALISTNMILASSLFLSLISSACRHRDDSDLQSDKNGNGGTVVVCEKNYPILDNSNIMVTDLYNLRQNEKMLGKEQVPDDLDGNGYHAVANAILERFKFRDYDLYLELKNTVRLADPALEIDAKLAKNPHMPNLGDEGVIELPGPDCKIEYAALQYRSNLPEAKTFNYREEIWSRLSELNRAVLLVHETVFYQFERTRSVPSENIRYIVARAFADKLPEKGQPYVQFKTKFSGISDAVTAFSPEEVLYDAKNTQYPQVDNLVLFDRISMGSFSNSSGNNLGQFTGYLEDGSAFEMGCAQVAARECYTRITATFNKNGKISKFNVLLDVYLDREDTFPNDTVKRWLEAGRVAVVDQDSFRQKHITATFSWDTKTKKYVWSGKN